MQAQTLHQSALQEVVDRIFASRQITRQDQQLLLSLFQSSVEEQRLINRVFDRLRNGFLKVVD
jgi:hypothetical protein